MQKLSGKSIYKFYKSCRDFHQESNKIEFAFFYGFYDFIQNLQESAKLNLLFKKLICVEVPGKIWDLTNMPLVHGWDPGKMETFATWSLGAVAGVAGAIPARPAAMAGRKRV
jgi:hypothetical protein